MSKLCAAALISILLRPTVAEAQATPPTEEKPQIGVLGIRAPGLETLGPTLVDVLVTEVANTGRYKVISANEVQAMLGLEKMKDALGCDEVSCMAEIGGALGVERMISGAVAKMGDAYVVTLQLINVLYGSVENRVSMQWEGSEVELVNLLGAAAQALVIPLAAKKLASVELTQLPEGAKVFVDNKPTESVTGKLAIGPHVAKIVAEGYESKIIPFVVKSGQTLTLDGSLERPAVALSAPGGPRRLAFRFEAELSALTDSFQSGVQGDPLFVSLMLEASYRFHRWLRVGLRAGGDVAQSETLTTKRKPWRSGTQVNSGGAVGLLFSTSPLYSEGLYDLSAEVGVDMLFRQITVASFGLPQEYSIGSQQNLPNNHDSPFFAMHLGASADYCLSPSFSIGLAVRYFWATGHTIRYAGKELHRSASALTSSARLAIRF